MKQIKALMILLILLCGSILAGSTLTSVQAVDEGKSASRISIRFSEAVDYRFNSSGNTINVALPGVKLGSTEPQYRRLSHVIDYISLSEDTAGSYVTIGLMADFKVAQNKTPSGLTIQIGDPPPQTQQTAVQKLSPSKPSASTPVLADTAVTGSVPQDSLASINGMQKAERKPQPKHKASRAELWAGFVAVFEAHPLIYGLCLLLILSLLAILLWPMRLARSEAEQTGPDLGLNGATLIMDANTKARMIGKLKDEGWTAEEISRELKLPLAEVEQIASESRFGD